MPLLFDQILEDLKGAEPDMKSARELGARPVEAVGKEALAGPALSTACMQSLDALVTTVHQVRASHPQVQDAQARIGDILADAQELSYHISE
ncbi:hypothetical protein EC988_005756 [Linderina pennispora]|nr:hypothetical protein EC988_005756 [Linderina pennispora]